MNEQQHIIKKVLLELTASDRNSALGLQKKASDVVDRKLSPALDRLFSTIGNEEHVVRIDKLVVDLGAIREKHFDKEFVPRTLNGIEEQLLKLIGSQSGVAFPLLKQAFEKGNSSARILSRSDYDLELFIHFLTTGCFPWWKKADSRCPVGDMLQQVLKLDPALLKERLLPLLKSFQARKRLVNQFGEEQLITLLRRIDETTVQHYLTYYSLMKAAVSTVDAHNRKLQKLFFVKVMAQLAEGGATCTEFQNFAVLRRVLLEYLRLEPAPSRQRLVEHIAQANKAKTGDSTPAMVLLASLLSASRRLPTGASPVAETITSICGQQRYRQILKLLDSFDSGGISSGEVGGYGTERESDLSEQDESSAHKSLPPAARERPERTTAVPESGQAQELHAQNERREQPGPQEPFAKVDDIAVTNSGLVILHPFLKYFFQGLGLLDDVWQFTNLEKAYRAAHLLQYLVTGKQVSPEYELPLNKILCGLDITEPVPEEVALIDAEIEECHNLLQAVLQRWQALRTQKTEALRETFLKRNGVLIQGAQGWILKVERNTFDVLLDKLPWSLSLVSLPWTPQLLSVEW